MSDHREGVSPLPREARPYQGRRAGLVTRMVAAGLDFAVVMLLLLAGYTGVAVIRFLLSPRAFRLPDVGLIFSLASAFVVMVTYLGAAWRLTGRTYGGAVMGLRVLGPRGRRLRTVGSFTRALFCVCLPIGIVWVVVSRGNRSVQDIVLRTSVVYDWQPDVGVTRGPHDSQRPGGSSP